MHGSNVIVPLGNLQCLPQVIKRASITLVRQSLSLSRLFSNSDQTSSGMSFPASLKERAYDNFFDDTKILYLLQALSPCQLQDPVDLVAHVLVGVEQPAISSQSVCSEIIIILMTSLK